MYFIITNDDGTVLSQKQVPDDTALTSSMEVFESAFRYADLRRSKGETDQNAGIYLPTGYVHVVEDGDGDPAVFANPDDAQEYADTYGDRDADEMLVCVGKVARSMIGDGEDEDPKFEVIGTDKHGYSILYLGSLMPEERYTTYEAAQAACDKFNEGA